MKDLAESIDFAMLATNLGDRPFDAIPMITKKVDEAGSIWFLSGKDSNHNQHIEADGDVQLIYSNPSAFEFLTVFGKATISTDKAVLKELYGKTDDLWFDGVDNPNLTAIQIEPSEAHYWDTKGNKLITMFKMGTNLLTGDKADLGESGDLNL